VYASFPQRSAAAGCRLRRAVALMAPSSSRVGSIRAGVSAEAWCRSPRARAGSASNRSPRQERLIGVKARRRRRGDDTPAGIAGATVG